MTELQFFHILLGAWFVMAGVTFTALRFISAPYGRHVRSGWGPQIPSRLAWMIMEAPALLIPILVFFVGNRVTNPVAIVFLLMWLGHYFHRTLIYPFQIREKSQTTPLIIVFIALFTNIGIDYLNARWLFSFGPIYSLNWFLDPRFILGFGLFGFGFWINRQSDHILLHLRKPGETGYKIPYGGFYQWVSCPNYLGELIEWTGWAIATWSLPGLAFAVWSAANLIPRALTHHQWYKAKFPDYPRPRKAILPYIL